MKASPKRTFVKGGILSFLEKREERSTIGRPGARTRLEPERARWDPKDGDLCLSRVKPGEILVEARRDTDVQIVR